MWMFFSGAVVASIVLVPAACIWMGLYRLANRPRFSQDDAPWLANDDEMRESLLLGLLEETLNRAATPDQGAGGRWRLIFCRILSLIFGIVVFFMVCSLRRIGNRNYPRGDRRYHVPIKVLVRPE